MDAAMADAAALGITVCVASGDNGSGDAVNDGQPHVDFPASSPHALACGGTKLLADPDHRRDQLRGGVERTRPTRGRAAAGSATTYALPSWQADAGVPPRAGGSQGAAGSGRGRGVPDVAGNADPATGYQIYSDGKAQVVGGTSAVAPLWAALIGRLAQATGQRFGLMQPLLYAGVRPARRGRLPRHHQREQRRLLGRPGLGRLLGPGQPRRHRPADPAPGLTRPSACGRLAAPRTSAMSCDPSPHRPTSSSLGCSSRLARPSGSTPLRRPGPPGAGAYRSAGGRDHRASSVHRLAMTPGRRDALLRRRSAPGPRSAGAGPVALRKLTADRAAGGPGAAARRDARVVLFLAGPAVDAFRTLPMIEPGRVHGAPPVTWIMRRRRIQLPFNRPQESGESGLAFGQQLTHVGLVVPGPLVLSLNVSAHKTSPGLDVTICRSRRPR